ncbi:hypothetical protein Ahy_B09g096217 isoform D [Arachis hypogaea]|uniref:DNA-directed RNA polymerases I and III subunit RPAC1 n=1 Tax=Arachis hypogaea TaxID=3818 RepID=A0A444XJ66_ARAHY|nr:hypothetical protein Ahy_B09g096217 isoform D [Arachis hypogaea]
MSSSSEDESMSEMEEQENQNKEMKHENGVLDYIMSLESVPTKLPPHLELLRTRVLCNNDAPQHTDTIQYSGAYAALGVDNSLRLDNFSQNFKVEVKQLTDDDIEFDMIGIDPSLANAFRRILIAEVPTMAIERVYIANNTSLIQDEVLSHRLGLIPISADPRLFEYPDNAGDDRNEKNTIVFKLHVACHKGQPRMTVRSDQLKWLPNGSELIAEDAKPSASSKPKTFTSFTCSQESIPEISSNPIGPKYLDIILAKLGPGQEIELEAHAVKGVGRTHAKWSPVSTAWYRMLPEVREYHISVLLKFTHYQNLQKLGLCMFDLYRLSSWRTLRMIWPSNYKKNVQLDYLTLKILGKVFLFLDPCLHQIYLSIVDHIFSGNYHCFCINAFFVLYTTFCKLCK